MKTTLIISQYVTRLYPEQLYTRVHSVFSNGFNVQVQQNHELIYVGHDKENLSAIGMVIDPSIFKLLKESVKVGQQFIIKGEQLRLYTRLKVLKVKITNRSIQDLTMVPLTKDNIVKSQVVQHIENLKVFEDSGFSKNENLNTLYQRIRKLKQGHFKEEIVEALIGAGQGLTPSGDDFLQGAMTMEYAVHQTTEIQESVQKALKKRNTTDVSVAYYQAVFNFQGNASWVNLFKSISKADSEATRKSILDIQRYGHTSGNDILLGMYDYLQKI